MPPKVKITKEDIVNAAVDIIRKDGADAINARVLASALQCSTQPIFSNFATMEELKLAVVEEADRICRAYLQQELQQNQHPPYKANGMAYIRFAKEEKELFKFLYMCDRTPDNTSAESDLNTEMENLVQQNTGLHSDNKKLFHFEMWACVHGIATMFATGFLDISWELVSKMLTDTYQGLRKQYGLE